MTELAEVREQIKQKLHSYTNVRRECKDVDDQILKLRSSMESPRIQALDGMPRGSGGGSDALAGLVDEMKQLEEKYKVKLHRLHAAMAEVEELIDSLVDPCERRLMRYRYIAGMTWESVCVEMNYSWRQTHRIHSAVLDKLAAAEMEKQEVTENV